MGNAEQEAHRRYLDYRERHGYFGAGKACLSREEFIKLDAEHAVLDARGDARDDEEEVRWVELARVLYRD